MAQNIVTTSQIDDWVQQWIEQGRFANSSEAFTAGIFALKEKLENEPLDPDFVAITRELDRHPGGSGEPTEADLAEINRMVREHRAR